MVMTRTVRALKSLFVGPLILVLLVIINMMTAPSHWWVQWPALGIGIAWVISPLRVLRVLILVGGVATLIAYRRRVKWILSQFSHTPRGARKLDRF